MIAAGAMGYAMETTATMEYWFNIHGDTFPKSYNKPIAGMIWSGGQVYGTWFSGDPAWIYGIQWLPWNPGFLTSIKIRSLRKNCSSRWSICATRARRRRRTSTKPDRD